MKRSIDADIAEASERLEDATHEAQLQLVIFCRAYGLREDEIDSAVCRFEAAAEEFADAELDRIRSARARLSVN